MPKLASSPMKRDGSHPGWSPGKRPHAPRAKIQHAKAPVHILDGERAAVGAESVRQRPDGVAADDPQRLRVYGVRRPVARDEQAPIRGRRGRRAARARRYSDGSSQGLGVPGVEAAHPYARRAVEVSPGVGDDQGAPVRTVVRRIEEAQLGAGGMAAERGRAPHARRIGVQDLKVSGAEVGACASGDRERVGLRIEDEAPDDSGRLMVGERLPCLRVEEGHGAIVVTDRERASVGAERARSDRIAVAFHDPDRRGTAQERREEVGAGGDRVVQRGAGAG